MKKLNDLKEILGECGNGNGKLVHMHNLSYYKRGGEDVRTFLVVRDAVDEDVFEVLRLFDCVGFLSGGDFYAEYRGDVVCGDLCPTVKIVWEYKNWNTKWDKDVDEHGDGFKVRGVLVYEDVVEGEVVKVKMDMKYVNDGDNWKCWLSYDGEMFKMVDFDSSSGRYAKTKMFSIASKSYPLEFYRREGFKSIYGNGLSDMLDKYNILG